jgi:hypothetical protein
MDFDVDLNDLQTYKLLNRRVDGRPYLVCQRMKGCAVDGYEVNVDRNMGLADFRPA